MLAQFKNQPKPFINKGLKLFELLRVKKKGPNPDINSMTRSVSFMRHSARLWVEIRLSHPWNSLETPVRFHFFESPLAFSNCSLAFFFSFSASSLSLAGNENRGSF